MSIGFQVEKSLNDSMVRANIIPPSFTNAICYGQTGSGKTTGFILPNIDERMKAGHGMLIYIYKGNFDGIIKALALKNNRLDDVIEIGTPWAQSVNLLKNVSEENLKTWFDCIDEEKNDYWKSSAFSLLKSLIKALNTLHELSLCNKGLEEYMYEMNLAKIVEFCEAQKLKKLHEDILAWIEKISKRSDVFLPDLAKTQERQKYIQKNEEECKKLEQYDFEECEFEGYENGYFDEFENGYFDKPEEEKISADIFMLDELVEAHDELKNFTDLENKESGCGNRGVMEVLENMIMHARELESLNKSEINLNEIVNSNKIVIVNTAIMGEKIAKLFNLCFTSKLISRLNESKNIVPWTVFIDEAHKILGKESLPETSICRESSFEYIMCVQNKYLLTKALGLRTNEELAIITQNIAYQLSFYDPTDELCNKLCTHEFVHFEDSKLAKIKGKSEPIFIQKDELIEALKLFNKKTNITDKVLFNVSLENSSYIKPLSAKKALIYYNDGSKVEAKIMLKSKVDEAKKRANRIVSKR